MNLFTYIRGRLSGQLGTGAESMAYLPSGHLSPRVDGFLTRRLAVRGQMDVQAPAYFKYQQQFMPVALVGNGISLQGQMALQRLARLEKAS